ncbi:hypothetical protein CQW23_25679 [Capsicum baccatum]|uniref:F-box associated beta-propeller type 1 domain-containing protein n=1 Tax=Capsicum baccatum TaxID=33114 RepID=A0A2G2VLN8_CAPBA|nr:hypothetical protein CQW23_25679 [Capsicum baccatum]
MKGNFNVCSLRALFNKQQSADELYDVDFPTSSATVVCSANRLICLFNPRETYIWNPTINKCKKLLNFKWGSSFPAKYGCGYDESCDDYKALFIGYCRNSSRHLVNIYSLRTDSWTTVHEQFQGIFLINRSGKFVNGKLYWASSSTGISNYVMRKIISFDLANETWGSLVIPIDGEVNSHFRLGIIGSDLSFLYTCHLGATTSDIWILKDCRFWKKLFTIKYPRLVSLYIFPLQGYTFSMHFHQSNNGEIFISVTPFIMIFDGSTRKLEHSIEVEECNPVDIYVESLVYPLMISDQGHH